MCKLGKLLLKTLFLAKFTKMLYLSIGLYLIGHSYLVELYRLAGCNLDIWTQVSMISHFCSNLKESNFYFCFGEDLEGLVCRP
jgi:type III secretory pathway component EscU